MYITSIYYAYIIRNIYVNKLNIITDILSTY